MRREILFRGKDENLEWVYGELHVNCDRPHIHIGRAPFPYAGKRAFVVEESIGQFTGFTDKNGQRIFENDILQYNGVKYLVLYDNKVSGAFILVRKDDTYRHFFGEIAMPNQFEIVGNAFDNVGYVDEILSKWKEK